MALTSQTDDLEQKADAAVARGDFKSAGQWLAQLVRARPDDLAAWLKQASVQGRQGQWSAALESVTRALALSPRHLAALLMRAQLLKLSGRKDEAGAAFGRALAQAPETPSAQNRPALDIARTEYAAWQARCAGAMRDAVQQVVPMTPDLDRFITNAVHLTAPDREGPTHYCYPGLPEMGFYDRSRFSWLSILEAAVDDIQAEFEAVLQSAAASLVPYIRYSAHIPTDQWAALNHNKDWSALHLFDRGRPVDANIALCPVTTQVLAKVPQPRIPGAGPNALFSLLAPHTHIPPHTGITNTRLVCHLPLIVPEGCWFRVGQSTRHWHRGKAWVFDDTMDHEAMNPTDALRVILILDVWQPDLGPLQQAGIAAAMGVGGPQIHRL